MTTERIEGLTDEQLSELIAAHLFPRDPERCEHCGWPLYENVEEGCVEGNCSMRPMPEKRKPDMVNDPTMTVMLLSLEGFVSLDRYEDDNHAIASYGADFCGAKNHSVDCGPEIQSAAAKTPGRAIALAYVKAHNLTPSGDPNR